MMDDPVNNKIEKAIPVHEIRLCYEYLSSVGDAESFEQLHLGQMVLDSRQNIIEIVVVADKIEIVAFDDEKRTKFIPVDPVFV